jgi:hypothetical protein
MAVQFRKHKLALVWVLKWPSAHQSCKQGLLENVNEDHHYENSLEKKFTV